MKSSRPEMPVSGETITTDDGEAWVLNVYTFKNDYPSPDREDIGRLRAKLGVDYESIYFRVKARLKDTNEVKDYHCWEVSYDAERDTEDAPWR